MIFPWPWSTSSPSVPLAIPGRSSEGLDGGVDEEEVEDEEEEESGGAEGEDGVLRGPEEKGTVDAAIGVGAAG